MMQIAFWLDLAVVSIIVGLVISGASMFWRKSREISNVISLLNLTEWLYVIDWKEMVITMEGKEWIRFVVPSHGEWQLISSPDEIISSESEESG